MSFNRRLCRLTARNTNILARAAGAAVLVTCAFSPLSAGPALLPTPDGLMIYDTVHNVTWLANANLAASNRFGLPLCDASTDVKSCVNASGSMSYQAASAWVDAMNAANYLGHNNWQLPTTPGTDTTCPFVGPHGESFGFNCSAGALGSLYYTALALQAPNTAVPISNNTAGPFRNFQPYLYWSGTAHPDGIGRGTFSFNSGFQGSNTEPNYLYVLPMIHGKIPGTPAATDQGLQVNPGGQTVYDPVTNVTWLANANLAATNTFGLPACKDQGTPKVCVNQDGAMNWGSASQFAANMNSAAYLGQTTWELPPIDPNCDAAYLCDAGAANPFGHLYYGQLGLSQGQPVAPAPDIAAGPFHKLQPYLYWSCKAATIQTPCGTDAPAPGFQFTFSFGNGFLGTDVLKNDFYVTAYFVGSPSASSGPLISQVANAEGENAVIAPNTWIEIKGANLAPAADMRTWQDSDLAGGKMPTQLDGVGVTVNGKSAFVYYVSPTQVNVLTPPDVLSGPVQIQLTAGGATSAPFHAPAQPLSPSFFVFNGGPYVAAVHLNGGLAGPATLYPGYTTPVMPGETILLFANGFGPTSSPVTSGSLTQGGTLAPLPVVKIGGISAAVTFAGLVAPGEFQFNVIVPPSVAAGDQPIVALYNGSSTQAGTLLTVIP